MPTSHCYQCEDQPVKHLVLWEGRTVLELEGCSEDKPTAWRTSSSGCAIRVLRRLTNFNGWWRIESSGREYRIQLQAPNDWEVFANGWITVSTPDQDESIADSIHTKKLCSRLKLIQRSNIIRIQSSTLIFSDLNFMLSLQLSSNKFLDHLRI